MMLHSIYPFTAVVGQSQAKRAILIALVNPRVGGLLIGGRKGSAKTTLVRAAQELIAPRKIIDLPLNVTEDMLFGSIDIEYAVSKGERRFLQGILGRANDNVLYIDEANLLRQELLTAVLDANTAGFNHVERDGISFTHEVNYTVIGTMNPEEGILPGHILDRFGMYVDVQGEAEIANRVEIIKR
ncbi:MAG: AAA family ATPase, partial [Phascolarctobacterium sp.]|nr:AAA family ATPase [Phascolarctobacterium sp.]